MSLVKLNLAPIMRKAQHKNSAEDITYCRSTLSDLLSELQENGLSSYFSDPLSENEKKFLKTFFKTLMGHIDSIENLVPLFFQYFLDLDLDRAKKLTLTFGIHLVDGNSGLLYLSWSKGVFDSDWGIPLSKQTLSIFKLKVCFTFMSIHGIIKMTAELY